MAKRNVDLTSKEWRDLIFADKNKDFGAYKLREQSDKRHNMAFLYMLIGLAVVVGLILGYSAYRGWADERERLALQQEREAMLQAQLAEEQNQEEEEVEPEPEKYQEPEVPEVPDNVLETVRVTEINIVDEVKNKMLTQDEKTETDTNFGQQNQEGSKDADHAKAFEEKVKPVAEPEPEQPVKKEEPKKEEIFRAVEQKAQFPGGDAAMMKWLSSNIRYPESAQQNDIQGRVVVEFVVERDGSIGHAKVVKGVDRDLDKEALRVVNKMPKWQPGKNNGVAVRSYFTLPVTFKLQSQ